MLQAILIGNIGADAKVNVKDGSEFTTFRVAHNDTWTDANGTQHSNTLWVDCIMNGKPNVVEYLKQGTQVAIMGNVTLRTYSSEKDRCIKGLPFDAAVNIIVCFPGRRRPRCRGRSASR